MRQPKNIGRCIYCRTSSPPLTDEHIVPFGLNGGLKLLQASCLSCARITSRFERIVLRDNLFVTRAALETKTRNKKERQKPRPMVILRDGEEQTVTAHWKQHWKVAFFPVFPLPTFLDPDSSREEVFADQAEVITLFEDPKQIARLHNADDVIHVMRNPQKVAIAYARLLAKIGYGLAVDRFGLGGIAEAFVVPGILGKANDLGRWVGCDGEKTISSEKYRMWATKFEVAHGVIRVRIRLLNFANGPEYIVIVGRITETVQGFLQWLGFSNS